MKNKVCISNLLYNRYDSVPGEDKRYFRERQKSYGKNKTGIEESSELRYGKGEKAGAYIQKHVIECWAMKHVSIRRHAKPYANLNTVYGNL